MSDGFFKKKEKRKINQLLYPLLIVAINKNSKKKNEEYKKTNEFVFTIDISKKQYCFENEKIKTTIQKARNNHLFFMCLCVCILSWISSY